MEFPKKHHFVYHIEYTDLSNTTGKVEIYYYDLHEPNHDVLKQCFSTTGDNDNTYRVLHQSLHENVPHFKNWNDVEAFCELLEYVYAN